MLPITAIQSTGPDSLNAAATASGELPASGFMALVARSLAGQAAVVGETAPLLDSGGENAAPADPSALQLLQSLAIPALLTGLNAPAATPPTQGASTHAVGVELNPDARKKLPLDPAMLAAGKGWSQGEAVDDTASTAGSRDIREVFMTRTAPLRAGFATDLESANGRPVPASTVDATSAPPAQYQMVAAAHAGGADPAASLQTRPLVMHAQFATPGWQQELGDKVVWMAGNQRHFSDLVLNPPNMGTVEVRLHVAGTEAGAQFYAANPDVRHALEQALPRLREMMADAGIALGEAMVSNQSFSQRDDASAQSGRDGATNGPGSDIDGVAGVTAAAGRLPVVKGLLDYYA